MLEWLTVSFPTKSDPSFFKQNICSCHSISLGHNTVYRNLWCFLGNYFPLDLELRNLFQASIKPWLPHAAVWILRICQNAGLIQWRSSCSSSLSNYATFTTTIMVMIIIITWARSLRYSVKNTKEHVGTGVSMGIRITKENKHTNILQQKRTKQSRSYRAQGVQRYAG